VTALTLITQLVLVLTLIVVTPPCLMATLDIAKREEWDDDAA
jgi:hypothetical protein